MLLDNSVFRQWFEEHVKPLEFKRRVKTGERAENRKGIRAWFARWYLPFAEKERERFSDLHPNHKLQELREKGFKIISVFETKTVQDWDQLWYGIVPELSKEIPQANRRTRIVNSSSQEMQYVAHFPGTEMSAFGPEPPSPTISINVREDRLDWKQFQCHSRPRLWEHNTLYFDMAYHAATDTLYIGVW
jgi:hypothetical protein